MSDLHMGASSSRASYNHRISSEAQPLQTRSIGLRQHPFLQGIRGLPRYRRMHPLRFAAIYGSLPVPRMDIGVAQLWAQMYKVNLGSQPASSPSRRSTYRGDSLGTCLLAMSYPLWRIQQTLGVRLEHKPGKLSELLQSRVSCPATDGPIGASRGPRDRAVVALHIDIRRFVAPEGFAI